MEFQALNQNELDELRNEVYKIEHSRTDAYDSGKNMRRLNDFATEFNVINDKIADLNKQIFNINHELQNAEARPYVTKELFKKNLNDIIDEIEKKLNILNENTKEQLRVMNVNFMGIMKEKDEEFAKLSQSVRSMQTTLMTISNQINKQIGNLAQTIEDEVNKQLQSK